MKRDSSILSTREHRVRAVSVFALGVLALGVFFTRTGSAVVVPFTDEQLTQICDRISLGTVQSVVPSWNPAHEYIWTAVTVQVLNDLKGSGPNPLTIRVYGGTVNDTTLVVEDMPTFVPGQRAIVFLKPFVSPEYYVRGGPGGKFTSVSGVIVETGETESAFIARIVSYM